MNKWIFIDSYIEITFNNASKECLLYNVLDHKKLYLNKKYYEIIKRIYDNGYVLKIEKENKKINYLQELLIINYFGGIIETNERSFIFFPHINIQQDYKEFKNLNYRDEGLNVLSYITEFVIYIDGKKLLFINNLKKLFYQLKQSSIKKVILFIFNFNDKLRMLIDEMALFKFLFTIEIKYTEFIKNSKYFTEKSKHQNYNIVIEINPNDHINNCLNIKDFDLALLISNKNDYNYWKNIISHFKNYTFKLSTKNIDLIFLRENVFLEKNDIDNIIISKRDYDANKIINKNFFGRLILKNNQIFAGHCECESIYKFDENLNLNELAFKAVSGNNDWFLTRDKINPCKNCIYRNLCPPISEYEIKSNRYNFCNINS